MADEPSDELRALGGALYGAVGELRPTVRCLRDDLAGHLGDLEHHPFVAVLRGWRHLPPEGAEPLPELDHEAYLVTGETPIVLAPSDTGPAAWILAVGRTAEATTALEHAGALWPDEADARRFEADRLAGAIAAIRIEAPMGLQRARREPGVRVPVDAGVTATNWIFLETDERGATYLAMDVPGSGRLEPAQAARLMQVTLASVHADAEWEPCEALPSGAISAGLVFRHR